MVGKREVITINNYILETPEIFIALKMWKGLICKMKQR